MTAARKRPGRRIALVTGANQGLGFALVEGLAQELRREDIVYLTGRDPSRIREARERVQCARAQVRERLLDVRDANAVCGLAGQIEAEHGGVDIVFSNHYARVLPEDDPARVIAEYVDTNNLGTTRVLRAFGAILRPRGRLLVVASSLGLVQELPAQLHGEFETSGRTLAELDRTMVRWRDAVLEEAPKRRAGPSSSTSPPRSARSRPYGCSPASAARRIAAPGRWWPPSARA